MKPVLSDITIREIPINEIRSPNYELRSERLNGELDEFAANIKQFGLFQLPFVSYNSRTRQYELVFGNRRRLAALKAGEKTLTCMVKDNVPEKDKILYAISENTHRKKLAPLETAQGLMQIKILFGYDKEKIARVINKTIRFVEEHLALLDLPPVVQEKLSRASINVSQPVELTKLKGEPAAQIALAAKAETEKMPSEVVERFVKELKRHEPKSRSKARRPIRKPEHNEYISDEDAMRDLRQGQLRGQKYVNSLKRWPLDRWSPKVREETLKFSTALGNEVRLFTAKVRDSLGTVT